MTVITLEVPDSLARRLDRARGDLPRVLELGLEAYEAGPMNGFTGATEVLEFLAGLPSPEEVLALTPTPGLEARVDALLEKNRAGGLSSVEAEEWAQYEALEHLVRLAKARAYQKLHTPA